MMITSTQHMKEILIFVKLSFCLSVVFAEMVFVTYGHARVDKQTLLLTTSWIPKIFPAGLHQSMYAKEFSISFLMGSFTI